MENVKNGQKLGEKKGSCEKRIIIGKNRKKVGKNEEELAKPEEKMGEN